MISGCRFLRFRIWMKTALLIPELSKCWIRRPIWFVSDLPIAANIMTVWRRRKNFAAIYQETCGGSQAVVDCIGHTHIDVAWLWTLAQTREKAQRSFATVLALMEEYPEYKLCPLSLSCISMSKKQRRLCMKNQTACPGGRLGREGAM